MRTDLSYQRDSKHFTTKTVLNGRYDRTKSSLRGFPVAKTKSITATYMNNGLGDGHSASATKRRVLLRLVVCERAIVEDKVALLPAMNVVGPLL